MDEHPAISGLRRQDFYRGQIRSIHRLPEKPAELLPVDDARFLEEAPLLPSFSVIASVLFPEGVFSGVYAAVKRAFSTRGPADLHLLSESPAERRQFTILAAVLEAVDCGRNTVVVVKDESAACHFEAMLQRSVRALDFEYVAPVLRLRDELHDGAALKQLDLSLPPIVIVPARTFYNMLFPSSSGYERAMQWVSSVGRLLLPDFDDWTPETRSHAALSLRTLHVRSARARRSCNLSFVSAPTADARVRFSRMAGRPQTDESFVRCDHAQLNGGSVVVYSSPLVTDPASPARLVAKPDQETFGDLIRYLAGEGGSGSEDLCLHYIIDHSVSMSWGEGLNTVKSAIVEDFKRRAHPGSREAGTLSESDKVSVIQFDDRAETLLPPTLIGDPSQNLEEIVSQIQIRGGTDFFPALRLLIEQAEASGVRRHAALILTDGGFSTPSEESEEVLNRLGALRAQGVEINLTYMTLDFDPPVETIEFVRRIGGVVLESGFARLGEDLSEVESASTPTGRKVVVLHDPGSGLSTRFIQDGLAGTREVVVLDSLDSIVFPEEDVYAVVMTGWRGGYARLKNLCARLGRGPVPTFVLVETHPRTLLLQDGPEFDRFDPLLTDSILPADNRFILRQWLGRFLESDSLSAAEFAYLATGYERYDLLSPAAPAPEPGALDGLADELGAVLIDGRFRNGTGGGASPPPFQPQTATTRTVFIEDGSSTRHFDEAVAPIRCHRGKRLVLDSGLAVITDEVSSSGQQLRWIPADGERRVLPVLADVTVTEVNGRGTPAPIEESDRLGEFRFAGIELTYRMAGRRTFANGRIDGPFSDDLASDPGLARTLATEAWTWTLPEGCPTEIFHHLLGILLQGLQAVFRDSADIVLPLLDRNARKIHLIDLTPGGNGAARLFAENRNLVDATLAIGAWSGLVCACESSDFNRLQGEKPDEAAPLQLCPRCSGLRAAPVQSGLTDELAKRASTMSHKLDAILWLGEHIDLLPDTIRQWIDDKRPNPGVTDTGRFVSRQGAPLPPPIPAKVVKVFKDRFGLRLDDFHPAKVAGWVPEKQVKEGKIGGYNRSKCSFQFAKGMPEWLALDVYAHEFFHNLQSKLEGFFAMEHLEAEDIPMERLLFVEGSAVWAESHVVEAFSIRTALDINNLRQGDAYGEGFRMIKYIEEEFGGIRAVLDFLASGDIARISGGRYRNLEEFWKGLGIS